MVAACELRGMHCSSCPFNGIPETLFYLRLAAGSGTTLVDQMRPALGWRCRCSLFSAREARNGTSFCVEQMRDVVWSSRSLEQGDTVSGMAVTIADWSNFFPALAA